MPKKTPNAHRPQDAMARFDRLLSAMAPKPERVPAKLQKKPRLRRRAKPAPTSKDAS